MDIKDDKLKRRVLNNLNQLDIASTFSKKAIFLVSPQDKNNNKTFVNNSKDRIKKMSDNLHSIINFEDIAE